MCSCIGLRNSLLIKLYHFPNLGLGLILKTVLKFSQISASMFLSNIFYKTEKVYITKRTRVPSFSLDITRYYVTEDVSPRENDLSSTLYCFIFMNMYIIFWEKLNPLDKIIIERPKDGCGLLEK